MASLLLLTCGSTFLAFLSQRYYGDGLKKNGKVYWDAFLVLLTIGAVLFCGLRNGYNDTGAYISSFINCKTIAPFLLDSSNFHLLHNPLFYLIQSSIRTVTSNYHIFLMLFASFYVPVFIWFLRKYSGNNFFYTILIYFCIGTYMFGLAAIKQMTAMAIVSIAIDRLLQKKRVAYFGLIIIAGLIHTYAFMFLLIPLIKEERPWGWKSLLLCLATLVVMMTFNSTITSLLEFADQAGKSVAASEVFDQNGMNLFRVAVYAVPAMISLLFRKWILEEIPNKHVLFIDFSVFSFLFMLMASMNGANMFGRLARYFVTYGFISLPWIIDRVFTKKIAEQLKRVMVVCFIAFLVYDNYGIWLPHISLFDFLLSI